MHELDYNLDAQGRTRFYGIYSAKVVNVDDPLNKGRIQVIVTQTTGTAITGWASACLPITSNANHPDHEEHTASQIAALLTTQSTTTADAQTGSITIPALTVVAKSGAGTLSHPHKTTPNSDQKWNDSQEVTSPAYEHSPHRVIARKNQLVWVMFAAGDPEYPVWIGVQP